MPGAGAAADGLRQRLPRAARAGAHRRRRAPAARGAHRHPLRAPRVRARPGGRGGLGCPQSIRNCSVTAAGGALGLWLLYRFVNPLPMWLTVATFIGYAVLYTLVLKPATPQNIVIGGASGAMPPVLGWAAVSGEVTTEAMLLFLIIFAWTPPHFWSLALYRTEDYARAGVPMLPVTHGKQYTRLQVLLYTLILFAVTLLPYVVRMSGWLYLGAAIALGGVFIAYALRIYLRYSDRVAQKTFRYSIVYLAALFAALLVDHYL